MDVLGSTLAVIFIVIVLVGLVLFQPSTEKVTAYQLDGTDLTVLELETTYYGCEEVETRTCYYLLGIAGDTLSFQWVPYRSVDGIVYMRDNGVYDCRSQKPVLLIKSGEGEMLGEAFQLERIGETDSILIRDLENSHEYIYDLKKQKLSVK